MGNGVLERYIACVCLLVLCCVRVYVCVLEKVRKGDCACERRAKGMNDRGSRVEARER